MYWIIAAIITSLICIIDLSVLFLDDSTEKVLYIEKEEEEIEPEPVGSEEVDLDSEAERLKREMEEEV